MEKEERASLASSLTHKASEKSHPFTEFLFPSAKLAHISHPAGHIQ